MRARRHVGLLTLLAFPYSLQMAARMGKKISEIVTEISKRPLPSWKKHLVVEVVTDDEEGEDVEVPFIVVHL